MNCGSLPHSIFTWLFSDCFQLYDLPHCLQTNPRFGDLDVVSQWTPATEGYDGRHELLSSARSLGSRNSLNLVTPWKGSPNSSKIFSASLPVDWLSLHDIVPVKYQCSGYQTYVTALDWVVGLQNVFARHCVHACVRARMWAHARATNKFGGE
jgi:hypothetical protein